MENKINEILNELYVLDPDLRKEDRLIREILSKMYAIRPDITADPVFIESLRKTILEKINQMSVQTSRPMLLSILNAKYAYAFVALIVVVIIIPSVIWISQNSVKTVPLAEVDSLQDNAFGSLAYQPTTGGIGGGGGKRSQSGGGGGGGYAGNMMATEIAMPAIYPGPDYTQIKYIYDGDDFDIPLTGTVYKRKISSLSGKSVLNLVKNLPLSDLKNPMITDLSLSEDREFGYSISVSIRENMMSFYQNWERWPMSDTVCSDEECAMRDYLTESQFPDDSKIVSIADKFLKEYGIDMSSYGKPRVMKPWQYAMPALYENVADQKYSPEISILYPLMLEGNEIYDEWGNQVGMTVNVSVKFNRVIGAFNISLHSYEKSNYGLVQDKERILDALNSGGMTGDVFMMQWRGRTINVHTGSPKLVLMAFYRYMNGKQELLYAPALRFPISQIPADGSFYRENVIIPLVPDILDNILSRRLPMPEPLVAPMPVPGAISVPETQVIEQ